MLHGILAIFMDSTAHIGLSDVAGTWPRWLRAQKMFPSIKPFAKSDKDFDATEVLCAG